MKLTFTKDEKNITTEVNRDIIISIIYGGGGAIGGYGNALQIDSPPFNSILLGCIAATILGSLLEYKLKKNFTARCCFAIALAGGLCSPAIIKGVRDIVNLPFENKQLRNAIAIEQQESIQSNKSIASSTDDPKIKKKAIASIAEVAERSENVAEGIDAIQELADDSDHTEVELEALDKLNNLANRAETTEKVDRAAEAIDEIFNDDINETGAIEHIQNLAEIAINTESEAERKKAIESMLPYYAHFNTSLKLMVAATLDRLHKLGKNDYYLVDVDGSLTNLKL